MSLSIVVMSCDKYADLWTPFADNFKKYWAHCSYQVYLVAENVSSDSDVFAETILCGSETEWTDRLAIALQRVQTEYILLLCEDYFICDQVDEQAIENLLILAKKYNVGNLRMIPNPRPTKEMNSEPGISIYEKKTPYRIATQAGIWRRDFLLNFTDLQTSIWGFERIGSQLSDKYEDLVLCTTLHSFPFIDAVHKGRWEKEAISLCQRNRISINLQSRKTLTNVFYVKKYVKGTLIDFAPKLTFSLMNFISKFKSAHFSSAKK